MLDLRLTLSYFVIATLYVITVSGCHKDSNNSETQVETAPSESSRVSKLSEDIESGRVFEDPEAHQSIMQEMMSEVPGLQEKVKELLATVKEKNAGSGNGIRGIRGAAPGCLAKGGGACPNICVYAAAFASAFACAWAEAHACATCGAGASKVTVCAHAKGKACAWAFGYGFAYACMGGGPLAAAVAMRGAAVDEVTPSPEPSPSPSPEVCVPQDTPDPLQQFLTE